MSAAKHTPGPWVAGLSINGGLRCYCVADTDGRIMATGIDTEELAAIIARAPDLLAENEALRAQAQELRKALEMAVMLLRANCGPESLGGERFDLTDCKDMASIFAALAKVTP